MLEISMLLNHVDHTLLLQTAVWDDVRRVCEEGIRYCVASVCIPPCYVKNAKEFIGDKLAICTVIGFPNGYNTTAAKVFETEDAVRNGADEIDMVINIGYVKSKNFSAVLEEIKQVRNSCRGKILKVIIEACLLTEAEKEEMCRIVTESGADYIKTSTGFSTTGATFEDIELFSNNIGSGLKIKASGGISCKEDADRFVEMGCDRLGTSKLVKLAQNKSDETSTSIFY